MDKESTDTPVALLLVETLSMARLREKPTFSRMMVVLLKEPFWVTRRWVKAHSFGLVERSTKVTLETMPSMGKDL